MSARSCKRGLISTNKPIVNLSTNPHVEYPPGSPDFIFATSACARGLPLMSYRWIRRTGRDGAVRAEPGARASAWLARRQADHGRHRCALLTWECGEVASVIHCTAQSGKACAGGSTLSAYCLSSLFRIDRLRLCPDCPAFFRSGTYFFSSFDSKWKHHATSSYHLRGNRGSNGDLNPYRLFVFFGAVKTVQEQDWQMSNR